MPPLEVLPAFRSLAIALVLGLLVGIQRQRSEASVGGVRTFALATILGCCAAILGSAIGAGSPTPGPDAASAGSAAPLVSGSGLGAGLIIGAGAIGVITFAVLSNVIQMRKGEFHAGMSTEIALLAMYGVGAMAWLAPIAVTAGVGVGIAVLLHAKAALHAFSGRLGEKDVRAVLTFALITFIILPVVPNQTFGPFDVLNPHEAWRMVVLVVGMSLAGYIAVKIMGSGRGIVLAGLLGGLVSSTATTAAAARSSRQATGAGTGESDGAAGRAHATDNLGATMVLLATVVMYARVLTEVAVVAPQQVRSIAPPIAILGAATLVLALVLWRRASRTPAEIPEAENPAALRPALVFGLLYAGVLFVAAAGQHYLGAGGLFVVAGISGLTDMDAITLSSARLVQDGRLAEIDAARAILIAATANMVFKTGLIATLGSPGLLRRVGAAYAICAGVAIVLALAWPG